MEPAALPRGRRRDAVLAALLLGAVLALYASTASYTGFQFNDVRGAALGAWALVNNGGSVILPSDWGPNHNFWLVPAGDGVAPNRFPGLFLVGLPAYAVARLAGAGVVAELHEVPMWPATVTAVVTATATVAVLGSYARQVAGIGVGLTATVAIAFGTPLWTFASRGLWPHGPAALLIALMIVALHRERLMLAAFAAGALPLFRPHLALVALVLCLWIWHEHGVRRAFYWGLPTGAAVVALAIYSQVVFSTWVPAAGYDAVQHVGVARLGIGWFVDEVLRGLAHQRIGVLVHSTYLLVLLPFCVTTWRTADAWIRVTFLAGVVYYLAQAVLAGTQGGGLVFGYRVQLEAVILSVPLLIHGAQRMAEAGTVARFLGILTVAIAVVFHGVALTTM